METGAEVSASRTRGADSEDRSGPGLQGQEARAWRWGEGPARRGTFQVISVRPGRSQAQAAERKRKTDLKSTFQWCLGGPVRERVT